MGTRAHDAPRAPGTPDPLIPGHGPLRAWASPLVDMLRLGEGGEFTKVPRPGAGAAGSWERGTWARDGRAVTFPNTVQCSTVDVPPAHTVHWLGSVKACFGQLCTGAVSLCGPRRSSTWCLPQPDTWDNPGADSSLGAPTGVRIPGLGSHEQLRFWRGWALLPLAARGFPGPCGLCLPTAHCDAAPAPVPPIPEDSLATGSVPQKVCHSYPVTVGEELGPLLRPILGPLHHWNVGNTALRCAMLAYLPLLERYLPQEDLVDEDEEAEEEGDADPPPPLPPLDLVAPAKSAAWCTGRELAVQVLRRVLDRACVPFVSRRTGWELTKDTHKAAKDRARRGPGTLSERTQHLGELFVETLKGHVLGSVANLLVQLWLDLSHFTHFCYLHSKAIRRRPRLLAIQLSGLQRKFIAHSAKAVGALLAASAGAALGEVVWPGNGHTVGLNLGDMLGGAAVNKLVDPIVIRLQRELDANKRRHIREAEEEEATGGCDDAPTG